MAAEVMKVAHGGDFRGVENRSLKAKAATKHRICNDFRGLRPRPDSKRNHVLA